MEHKLSAYADYVFFFFYVAEPLISLPNIMDELQRFHSLSNFKINYSKSEILPFAIPSDLGTQLQASFSFTWCRSSLKYSQPYSHNYTLTTMPPSSPQSRPTKVGPYHFLLDGPSQYTEDECVAKSPSPPENGAHVVAQIFLLGLQ